MMTHEDDIVRQYVEAVLEGRLATAFYLEPSLPPLPLLANDGTSPYIITPLTRRAFSVSGTINIAEPMCGE